MALEQYDTVLPEEDQDLEGDDDESSEDDGLEENDDVLPDEEDLSSASVATPTATVAAFPSSSASTTTGNLALTPTPIDEPDPKRRRIAETVTVHEGKKPLPQQSDESRRLFQRLWTDEDEIELLQGFLDYTTERGNTHHPDTASLYDRIKSKLQLDFNKNQLVEKLRRLKKKYRNVINKISSGKDFSFKTAHDQATFEISRKIWSSTTNVSVLDDEDANNNSNNLVVSHELWTNNNNNISSYNNNYGLVGGNNNEEKVMPRPRKRYRSKAVGTDNVSVGTTNNCENVNVNSGGGGGSGSGSGIDKVVEETVRSCLSPLFKELLSNAMGGVGRGIGRLPMNAVMPMGFGGAGVGMGMMGFGGIGVGGGKVVDEKLRKQQILEFEVYSKRLELVQDQIKVALEELRSWEGK